MLHTLPADAMDVEHTSSSSHASAESSLARLRRFSSPATSNPASSVPTTFPTAPSRDEERDFILHVMSERLRPHQTCFIISMGWWNAWKAYVGLAEDPSQAPTFSSPRPGPINNLPLCPNKGCPTLMELCALRVLAMQKKNKAEQGASCTAEPHLPLDVEEYLDNFDKTLLRRALCRSREMKPGLVEGKDCVAVPILAWKAFHSWYGGGPVIPRPVIGVGVRQRLQVELYPITLLVVPVNSGRSSDKETHRFTFSPHDQVKTVRRAVCGRFLIPPHKVDLFWHQPGAEAEHLSNLELTLGHMGLNDGCLVSLQRAAHFHPTLGTPAFLAAPAAAPQAYPVPTPQLPQNADDNARPLASPAQPL